MTDPSDAEARAAALADRLRDAHRALRSLDVSDDEKARAARRLLAISDAAKHDVDRAALRLDSLLSDWEAGRVGAADDAGTT
ncbi:MAG: hypothetical protein Q8R60_03215 [Mycobacteriales bacterium]|nr:hypothetical protein [Mycobacteriales bacterium]